MTSAHTSSIALQDNPLNSLLKIYTLYRLVVVVILWSLFFLNTAIGDKNPTLFYFSGFGYLLINLFLLQQVWKNWLPNFSALIFIVMSDIILLQLIARASGPYDSGISILMLIAIATGSMFITKHNLLLPALATITILFSSGVDYLNHSATTNQLVASGWLSLAFFIVNLSIHYLTTRLQTSELQVAAETARSNKLSHLNALIIERMQTGVIVVSSNGIILSCNSSARQLLELDNIEHEPFKQNMPLALINQDLSDYFNQWQQFTPQVKPKTSDTEQHSTSIELEKSGTILQLTPIHIMDTTDSESLIFIEDMSKIAQQAQHLKLSSLGKLTASIAHEIRNPIGAVSHASQLLKLNAQTSEDQKLTTIICDQAKRCSNIIESVMNVSRGKASNIEQFDLVDWLPKFITSYTINQQHDISIEASSSLKIRFDKSQLEQIVSNLLDNGFLAGSKNHAQPKIKIIVQSDQNYRPILDVIDQGNGVNDIDSARLFEPFFTTGKTGSGLGLYICRELCRANQATITYIKTEQEHASFSSHCFRIHFSHPNRQPIQLHNIFAA